MKRLVKSLVRSVALHGVYNRNMDPENRLIEDENMLIEDETRLQAFERWV
jgi:hypothetical protein